MGATIVAALLLVAHITGAVPAAAAASPKVIIVGAGFSGISAAKTLLDAGIKDIMILEATDRIGGRIHKTKFAGLNIELGANWVEGVNGKQENPIWKMAKELRLRNFYSDFSNLSSNIYKQDGGLYEMSEAQKAIDVAESVTGSGEKLSSSLPASGRDDISVLTYQRLKNQ